MPPDPLRERAARRAVALAATIRAAPPESAITDLAARVGLTRQQLARLAARDIGLRPKQLQRVARMERALALLRSAPRRPLAEVALAVGCCDQAHLTHELRELAAVTPAIWRASAGD